MPTPDATCRWGLLSTAAISRKNWKAIALAPAGTVTAVASRDESKVAEFIGQCMAEAPLPEPPTALGSYDALLGRDDVDAVYIALPTGLRKPWVLRAAAAGKHVLCEKPLACTLDDAREMAQACHQHGVQLIDGVMFSHSRRLTGLRQAIDAPDGIGPIRRVSSHFCFCSDETFRRNNIRVHSELEPHGCLGDLGWYNIRFILWVLRFQMPTVVVARTLQSLRGEHSPGEVPGEFSAELLFDGNVSANFFCSFLVEHQQLSSISGQRGHITLDDFVLPFYDAELAWHQHRHVLEIDNCRWNMRRHSQRCAVTEYASGERNAAEVKMITAMNQAVLTGRLDPYWPEIALKTQQVLEACRRSADQGGRPVEL